jgi:hypothetical protein
MMMVCPEHLQALLLGGSQLVAGEILLRELQEHFGVGGGQREEIRSIEGAGMSIEQNASVARLPPGAPPTNDASVYPFRRERMQRNS